MKLKLIVAMLLAPAFAAGAETVSEVTSDVIAVEGMTAQQIADRAGQCLKSASDNVADKVDPSHDGDNTYAIVITGYTVGFVKSMVRSRMTVFAKDGRFKIAHTDIELYREMMHDWGPLYTSFGAGGKQGKTAMEARSAKVADCITKKTEAPGGDNW